jgi:hypothetical protein
MIATREPPMLLPNLSSVTATEMPSDGEPHSHRVESGLVSASSRVSNSPGKFSMPLRSLLPEQQLSTPLLGVIALVAVGTTKLSRAEFRASNGGSMTNWGGLRRPFSDDASPVCSWLSQAAPAGRHKRTRFRLPSARRASAIKGDDNSRGDMSVFTPRGRSCGGSIGPK